MVKDKTERYRYLYVKNKEIGIVSEFSKRYYIYDYKKLENIYAGDNMLELSTTIKNIYNLYNNVPRVTNKHIGKEKVMREKYEIKLHDMTENRIYIYKTFAISLEDAYLQAKVIHSCYMYTNKKNAELNTIEKKQNNENQ